MRKLISSFLRDERGATTVEMAVIFLPLMVMVLTVFEIGIAYHFMLTAQKAAELGVRYISTRDPIHTGMPRENTVHYRYGSTLDACYQGGAISTDACLDPGGPWVCDGAGLAAECDATEFAALMAEMQRLYPSVTNADVEVTYIYRRLGYAGGDMIPEIRVRIKARPSPLQLLSFLDLFVTVDDSKPNRPVGTITTAASEDWDTLTLREVTASSFGEDMSSDN